MLSRTPLWLSIVAIALLGLVNLVRGSIHFFAPDGGLKTIAALDISQEQAIILSFIGAVGAGQLTMALVDFAAATYYRPFVRPLLLIHTAQAVLAVLLLFVWRPLPQPVPGQWGALVGMVLIALVMAIEFSRKDDVAAS
ncbi:MAG: hypothetical protein HOP13_12835 [Alphaproteobacteria bacterium]|nr:hypothetical protein [Alphaproteobacteria bacterium]